jgi:hypothetical protein
VRVLLLAALVLTAGFACPWRKKPAISSTEGTVDLEWTGSTKGHFIASAVGQWCKADSMLEVTAIRGDTGVAIALVTEDTLKPGQHPIVLPSVPVKWRPLARTAIRWIGKAELEGFEGSGGNVHVTELGRNTVSGRVDARLRAGNRRDTLRLIGTFTRIPIRANPSPCGRISKGETG